MPPSKPTMTTTPGTFLNEFINAVFIPESNCKIYIISCKFSDDHECVYRVVYHGNGLKFVTLQ